MSEALDLLVLSPHLDDAALSCGGEIRTRTRRGERVRVVTLFAGDAPAEGLTAVAAEVFALMRLSPREAMKARRAEDVRALDLLGAEAEHWDLPESIHRRDAESGEPCYRSLRELFGQPTASDRETLMPRLRDRLAQLPPARRILAPLGIGEHVDHRLSLEAARAAFGSSLCAYEDQPYVLRRFALRRTLSSLGHTKRSWRPEIFALAAEDLEAKLAAVAAYGSQIAPLFGDPARMARALTRHANRRGGERCWQPPQEAD